MGAIKAERSEFFGNFFLLTSCHLNILCYRLYFVLKLPFFEINYHTIQTALTQNLKVLKMVKYLFVCFQSQVYVNSFLDGNVNICQDMW